MQQNVGIKHTITTIIFKSFDYPSPDTTLN